MTEAACRCGELRLAEDAERLAVLLDEKRVSGGSVVLSQTVAAKIQAALESAASTHKVHCGCTTRGDTPDATEAVDILRDLYDEDEPCRFDHHGYCQEHLWFVAPTEDIGNPRAVCPHARAKAFFAKYDAGSATPARESKQ